MIVKNLVKHAEYIVVAEMQNISNLDKTAHRRKTVIRKSIYDLKNRWSSMLIDDKRVDNV